VVGYWSRADEGYVRDGWVGREVVGDVRPADYGLDDIGGVTACFEGFGSDRGEV
jgi:hypothetical protein